MDSGKRRYLTNWLNMTSRNFRVIPAAGRSMREISHQADESIDFSIPEGCQLVANGVHFVDAATSFIPVECQLVANGAYFVDAATSFIPVECPLVANGVHFVDAATSFIPEG
jgi:hypothetical protein